MTSSWCTQPLLARAQPTGDAEAKRLCHLLQGAAVICDAFSLIVLWQMDACGFCGFGESGTFVPDGALRGRLD